MKFVKIRFTTWRDQGAAPPAREIQEQHDEFSARMNLLAANAARMKKKRDGNSQEDQKSVDGIAAEKAAADAEECASRTHKKVGTFGYQLLDETGTRILLVLDEAGDYLSAQALYTCEVVDENPPLPEWAKEGRFK